MNNSPETYITGACPRIFIVFSMNKQTNRETIDADKQFAPNMVLQIHDLSRK